MLSGADYRRAHEAAHANAGIWNNLVDWLHATWGEGLDPSKNDLQTYVGTLTADERPVHVHTAQAVAHDLADAVMTYRANRKNGVRSRAPWRGKNYRPLSFTRNYGWRVRNDRLRFSFGRGRPHLNLPLPTVTDPITSRCVDPTLWGEIRLCWDTDAREWSLHIAVPTSLPPALDPDRVTAIDEGIINPMTLATQQPNGSIDVTVINGREARAIKRHRSKTIGALDRKISRCADGSRRRRKLMAAKKKAKARAKKQLRDFNHHVTRKATSHIQAHDTGRVVVGDVRGIEANTRKKQRASRSTRQQLSQWERGRQETYLAHKTGVSLNHIDESYSSQTCPACLTRNRPLGRRYRCRACQFTCHRDAVGAINILMRAIHGNYTRIDPDTIIRVTYLRAVPRWSPDQRKTRSSIDVRKHQARSKAKNLATNLHVGDAGTTPGSSAAFPHGNVDPQVVAA